jgi:molecular chaperone HscB
MFNIDNYFDLFSIPTEFNINKELLFSRFIELQNKYHPDKQINKLQSEKILLAQLSQEINKAYKILLNDKTRAEYLLKLQGITINQEEGNNVNPDPIMLSYILDISENPELYNIAELKEQCLENFYLLFKESNLQEAAKNIIKLQYLEKIHS